MKPTRNHRGPWREFRALIATELFGLAMRCEAQAAYDIAWMVIDDHAKRQVRASRTTPAAPR